MNRKLAGALVALVLIGLAVWFFALRDRGGDSKAAPDKQGKSGAIEIKKPEAKSEGDSPPPSGDRATTRPLRSIPCWTSSRRTSRKPADHRRASSPP